MKGQQYTGSSDVAMNFVKMQDGRYLLSEVYFFCDTDKSATFKFSYFILKFPNLNHLLKMCII